MQDMRARLGHERVHIVDMALLEELMDEVNESVSGQSE
jgi:hypothetical protein